MKHLFYGKLKLIPAIILILLASGCASSPASNAVDINNADYGKYPVEYASIVKTFLGSYMKDPYSAVYRFSGKPYKAYLRSAPISGGQATTFGYISEVWVNAKNSYGAYIGERLYRVYIHNEVAYQTVVPNSYFSEPWYQ